MKKLTDQEIIQDLSAYGVDANSRICGQIRTYIELISLWNKKISLTTRDDPFEILKFHFGESVFGLKCIAVPRGGLADIGSGSGFPGLPIALFAPEIKVTLLESNGKKAAFLSEVVRRLELSNVEVVNSRMDEVEDKSRFNLITVRAVAQTDGLFRWAKSNLSQGGRLLLWLGEEGVKKSRQADGWSWDAPILIPGSTNRFLLSGSVGNFDSPSVPRGTI